MPEVRQSVFALIGDICMQCFSVLQPHLSEILKEIFMNCDPSNANVTASVANNAVWALGEISMKDGDAVRPFIPELLGRLAVVLQRNQLSQRHLLENICVCMGRLSLVSADALLVYLPGMLPLWCKWMGCVRDAVEKESAFRGMLKAISQKPEVIAGVHFGVFLEAMLVQYEHVPEGMRGVIGSFLSNMKAWMGEGQWREMQVSEGVRRAMNSYGV